MVKNKFKDGGLFLTDGEKTFCFYYSINGSLLIFALKDNLVRYDYSTV